MQASDIAHEAQAELDKLMLGAVRAFRDVAAEVLRPRALAKKEPAAPSLTLKI